MAFSTRNRLRPILKWAGGKTGPLSQLIPLFPRTFRHYIEPFMGGASVYLSLQTDNAAFLNDTNRDLIDLYEVVRDEKDTLIQELDALAAQYSEEFYYHIRENVPAEKAARAARTIFLNKTGYNGLYRINSKGQFNVPFGKRLKCPRLYDQENLFKVSRKLSSATLSCGDFEVAVSRAQEGDFVYCDPPYEPLSATSTFTSYTAAGFSQEDQGRLERVCRAAVNRGAIVAISNSTAPFVLDLYRDWNVQRIRVKRAINSKATSRGEIEEVVALSYLGKLK